MPRSILAHELWTRRYGVLGWAAGLALMDLVMVAVWPAVRDAADEYQKILESYPPEFLAFFGETAQFGEPAGFLDTELFSLMIPLLWLVFLIGFGAAAIAGEQERGTLELVLSQPVSRNRFLWQKAAAGGIVLLAFAALSTLVLLAGDPLVGLDPGWYALVSAHLFAGLLCLIFGSLALLVGAATGRRGLAIGVASASAAASWIIAALARVVEWLEPARWASPFHYYARHQPVVQGADPVDALVLALPTIVFLAAAWWTFRRRSLA